LELLLLLIRIILLFLALIELRTWEINIISIKIEITRDLCVGFNTSTSKIIIVVVVAHRKSIIAIVFMQLSLIILRRIEVNFISMTNR